MKLALHGGAPIRSSPWRYWPPYFESTADLLARVVRSGRWSPTGLATGGESVDRQFSRQFAAYLGAARCVTTSNGTTALRLGLEAAGIGWGDEVIIPALTWVADVDAVLSVGATPVLVDIESTTLCISPPAVTAARSHRTRAIVAVHLHGAVANLSALLPMAEDGVVLIEDAAQAHGACWRDQKVGAVGLVGAFSMHNSKLLTSGEGGAVVTSSELIADRVEALRANGRLPRGALTPIGEMEYQHASVITGTNGCLSEFQSAVLLDLLPRLDDLNAQCETNARRLEHELSGFGFTFQATSANTKRVYSGLAWAIDPEILERVPIDRIAAALGAECGVAFKRLYQPLNDSPLFRAATRPSWRWFSERRPDTFCMQHPACAWTAYETMLCIPHPYLRGTSSDMDDIVRAVDKVMANLSELEQPWTRATSSVS